MKTATLSLAGATCTSCSIGIVHMARRLPGVDTAQVDRATGTLHLDFDGNPETIRKIRGFVQAIGYDITLDRVENAQDAPPEGAPPDGAAI